MTYQLLLNHGNYEIYVNNRCLRSIVRESNESDKDYLERALEEFNIHIKHVRELTDKMFQKKVIKEIHI